MSAATGRGQEAGGVIAGTRAAARSGCAAPNRALDGKKSG